MPAIGKAWSIVRRWLEMESVFAPVLLKLSLEHLLRQGGDPKPKKKAQAKIEQIDKVLKSQALTIAQMLEQGLTVIICERSDDLVANGLRVLEGIRNQAIRQSTAEIFVGVLEEAKHAPECHCSQNIAKLAPFRRMPTPPPLKKPLNSRVLTCCC